MSEMDVIRRIEAERDRLREEVERLFLENGELANTLGAENLRLRAGLGQIAAVKDAEIERLKAVLRLNLPGCTCKICEAARSVLDGIADQQWESWTDDLATGAQVKN